ncbi:hypothetical protein HYS03_02255 [Candidatus Woesebacteria bacterium]|nr:hypothetical protein [Candidatus Woesebacteria bacterium]
MVTDPSEILGKLLKENITTKLDLTKEEKLIYDELSKEELSLDELSAKLQKSIIELSTTLSLMSIKGLVRESGGKFYI